MGLCLTVTSPREMLKKPSPMTNDNSKLTQEIQKVNIYAFSIILNKSRFYKNNNNGIESDDFARQANWGNLNKKCEQCFVIFKY